MNKQELAEIYQHTIWKCVDPREPHYVVPKPIYYNQELLDEAKNIIKPRFESTKVIVENEDSFDMAKRFMDEGHTTSKLILVLNMASAKRPGGGVENGASAQEECLFRRSNYFLHLPIQLYHLEPDALIVSRNVIVIKDIDYNMYANKVKPFAVNCIAASALVHPKTVDGEGGYPVFKYDRDYQKTKQKIYNLFKVAYIGGYDTLILGALGCGAFHNPVHVVADIFRETLEEFKGCFKTVAFAVLSKGQNQNYKIFKTHVEVATNGELHLK